MTPMTFTCPCGFVVSARSADALADAIRDHLEYLGRAH